MFRLTYKNLLANRVRFALTTFGVILAVSFVVSAFVLADGLRQSFTAVAEEITVGVDLDVRPVTEFGDPEPLPVAVEQRIESVDGVADAALSYEAPEESVRPLTANGEGIVTNGPPQLAFNWSDNASLMPFSLVAGQPPGVDEFTMDLDSADKYGFVIGNTYDVLTPSGRHRLSLSGTSSFGSENNTLGAVLLQVSTEQAGELFAVDGATSVSVELAAGADPDEVRAAIAAVVPGVDVVDNAEVTDERTREFTDNIDVVGNILLGFGGVALFVSMFIIYNTFAIVLGQRVRELALLRTIGADGKQIRRSVLGEALVIGTIASAGGLAAGIGVAKGLEALFNGMGLQLPESPTILATRTIVWAVVIGLGVTMAAAFGPARKAANIPAIAALRGADEATEVGSRTRIVGGIALLGVGFAFGSMGLAGLGRTTVTIALLAIGAIAVFLGVTLLSPMAVGFVTKVVGWPMKKVAGVPGGLAQQNAARNPRRTSTTAAALMVGLALVSTALVVGQSVKTSLVGTLQTAVSADYIVTDDTGDFVFPTALAKTVGESDVFGATTGFRSTEARVDGEVVDVLAADLTQLPDLLDIDVRDGGFDDSVGNAAMVTVGKAETLGLVVGDVITAEFSNGQSVDVTITGTYADQTIIDTDYLLSIATFEAASVDQADSWLAFSIADGADPTAVAAAIAQLEAEFPQANIDTAGEFQDRLEGLVDQTLAVVNVMVALAVIIALIGIANTLALSVFERTRELGLVRAVGMTRRQLRRMVRFEAALVALFGAVLGVSVGILFGWGVVSALPASFASQLSIPVARILTLVAVAAAAGVVAAWLPARRAGNLDVLDAIAQ